MFRPRIGSGSCITPLYTIVAICVWFIPRWGHLISHWFDVDLWFLDKGWLAASSSHLICAQALLSTSSTIQQGYFVNSLYFTLGENWDWGIHVAIGMDIFSLLNRATNTWRDSESLCLIAYISFGCLSTLRLLMNCFKRSEWWSKKEPIEELGKLVYHCKEGPARLDLKPLHMHALHWAWGIETVNILYL